MARREPILNLPPVVSRLALLLFAVHLAVSLLPYGRMEEVQLAFGFIPARYLPGGAALPGGEGARLWTPLTYALLHADWMHLAVNTLWLAAFGAAVARRLGGARFLALNAGAALAGAAAHYLVFSGETSVLIGASGAVSGVTAAAASFVFAPGEVLGPPIARHARPRYAAALLNPRALVFIAAWSGINLLTGLNSAIVPGAGGPIAWEAHLGGFLAGLCLFPLLDRRPPPAADRLA